MENTERPFTAGIYTVVDSNRIEAATRDGGELVRILMAPAASVPHYLIRNDRDKKLALEEARHAAANAKDIAERTRFERDEIERELATAYEEYGKREDLLRDQLAAAHVSMCEGNDRELKLRERLLAYEESLNLYRAEVGRARREEIEAEAVDAAALVMEPLKARSSSDVVSRILDLIELDAIGGVGVRVGAKAFALESYIANMKTQLEESLGW